MKGSGVSGFSELGQRAGDQRAGVAGVVPALVGPGPVAPREVPAADGGRRVDAEGVQGVIDWLARGGPGLGDGDRVDLINRLEALKGAAEAAQARVSVDLAESLEADRASAGVPQEKRSAGIGAQVALARGESPWHGSRHLGMAKALVHEMPRTMTALTQGRISGWAATLLVRATGCLSVEHRGAVDARVADRLGVDSPKKLEAAARSYAYQLDPAGFVARAQVGVNQRRVTLRPAPETMTYLTALLPLTEGVACLAALDRAANTTRATGDPTGQSRTRSQVMADELITRITGINPATDGMPVEIHLVIDPDTLLGDHHHDSADPDDHESHESHGSDDPGSDESHGSDDPAARAEKPAAGSRGCSLPEYGPIPAPLGRLLARTGSTRDPHTGTGGGPTAAQQAWVRRLFTAPDGTVTGQDTRRRFFTGALRELIIARDQTCRTPWCEAPIRHIDHITPHADGGPTTPDNGNGLCEACNYTKDAPGWHANATTDHHGTHTTTITTPTGHTYTSRPPPALNPTLPAPPDTDTG